MAEDNASFEGSIPELYDRHLGPVIFVTLLPSGSLRIVHSRQEQSLVMPAGSTCSGRGARVMSLCQMVPLPVAKTRSDTQNATSTKSVG
jgi:hypothetical protein